MTPASRKPWPALLACLLLPAVAGCRGDDGGSQVRAGVGDTGAGAGTVAAASAALDQQAAPAPPGSGRVPPDFTQLVKLVGPSVVNVTTTQAVPAGPVAGALGNDPLLEFFRRFYPQPPGSQPERRAQGVGSGFVIDAEGYVLTNAHVVADADEVTLRLPGSAREYPARVVGSDPQTDVALLKVDVRGLPAARLGDSQNLQIGEWVAAIGSPFGLANTITAGIVSAKERALPDESFVPFIQTDVAVNPGNSGGPLLNVRGEVVGINSQIYSRSGGYMGISFAIPIDVAMEVAQQLRRDGRVTRGRLGVGIQEVTPDLAQSFRLGEPRGALVTSVEPDGPGARAGVQPGDVILRFADKEVATAGELPRYVASTRPGTTVELQVWRDGAARTLSGTVGRQPTPEPHREARGSPAQPQGSESGRLGLTLSELPPSQRAALGVDYGLVVRDVTGPNDDTGLQPGDVIVGVGGQRLRSLGQFRERVEQARPGSSLALLVRRGDDQLYVPVTVGQG